VFADQEEFSTPENPLPTNSTTLSQSFSPNGISKTSPANAILLLNLVAIIWGSQHSVIKLCIADVDPSSFSLVRFLLAALIATPSWVYSSSSTQTHVNRKKDSNSNMNTNDNHLLIIWRWGIEMGLWMFLGYACQSIGLKVSSRR
jgi:drug/metabolite transporter (DMT)-like permease